MRDIKFRAWAENESKMFYDVYFDNLEVYHWINNTETEIIGDIKPDSMLQQAILMQYTGLKDKNGKEIFEGDVVKKVIWPDKEEYIEYVEDITRHNLWINELNNEPEAYLEVIGNLYENPELIRGE
jgi:uncharacterized phage protein (TIGR01671 family)